MSTPSPEWLGRLSAADWLAAADNELHHCRTALEQRAYRTGVTHARRAAGMACNAVLRIAYNEAWGRSYMDHIVALAHEDQAPQTIQEAAQTLVQLRPAPPALVAIGKPDLAALHAAERIIAWAADRVRAAGSN